MYKHGIKWDYYTLYILIKWLTKPHIIETMIIFFFYTMACTTDRDNLSGEGQVLDLVYGPCLHSYLTPGSHHPELSEALRWLLSAGALLPSCTWPPGATQVNWSGRTGTGKEVCQQVLQCFFFPGAITKVRHWTYVCTQLGEKQIYATAAWIAWVFPHCMICHSGMTGKMAYFGKLRLEFQQFNNCNLVIRLRLIHRQEMPPW